MEVLGGGGVMEVLGGGGGVMKVWGICGSLRMFRRYP